MKKLTILLFFSLICAGRMEAQSCQLQQTNNVNFMTYSSYAIRTTGSIMVNCTSGTTYSISLSTGGATGATVNARAMTCSSCTPSTLGYQLFSDATYTVNWGNAASGTALNKTGTGNSQTATIYGQIPALEAFYAGSGGSNYNDSVLVTINCSTCTSISANNQTILVHLQQTDVGCGIEANDLNFGNYTGTALNATTTLRVGCSNKTTYNVGLSAGTASGATVTNRSMTRAGGTALLGYKLLRGSYTGANWGNTVGTDTVAGTGDGTVQSLTVFGIIPAGQTVTLGTYMDTITATITY